VIVGIGGALLGGWLISPMVGAGTIQEGAFSLPALGVSLAGAVLLLVVVNLIRRATARGAR
jgi:uncharacterized membrane protein YeaQ/YmgE (transglycosylase-associated protein family)